jgi:hypothetical protein
MSYKSYQQDDEMVESAMRGCGAVPSCEEETEQRGMSRGVKYGLAVLASAVFVFAVSMTQKSEVRKGTSAKLFTSGILTDSDGDTIAISINTPGYTAVAALAMLPWDTVAEPYKTQDLSLVSVTKADGTSMDVDSLTVSWDMCYDKPDYQFTLSGASPTFQIDFTGACNCTVTVESDSENFLSTLDFTMGAKYVRREIRSLSRVGNVGSSLFGALRRASTVAGSAAVMAASAASSVAVSSVAAGSRAANPSSVLDPTSTGINASNSSNNILSSTLGGSSTPVKTQLLDLDDDPILASSRSPSYASPTAGHGSPGSSGSGGLLNVNESGTSTVSSDIDGSGSGSSNAIV